jgi:hypothetical protein
MMPCPQDCAIIAVIGLLCILAICGVRLYCEWRWRQ